MNEISELQKKRAVNIIWNTAGRYDFTPDFKAFDSCGHADLYWNCIIGAVRKHYDYPQFEEILRSFSRYEDGDIYESLFWLGLENCVFLHEVENRPALSQLRREYAVNFTKNVHTDDDYHLYDAIASGHFQRVLGGEPNLGKYDIKLLNELEFSYDMTTEEIAERTKSLFNRWFQIQTEERKTRAREQLFSFKGRNSLKKAKNGRYRKFGIGFAEKPSNAYGGIGTDEDLPEKELATKMSAEELRLFMQSKYGKSMLSDIDMLNTERELCRGSHQDCHLHFTKGEPASGEIHNGFEALQKLKEAKQIEKNKQYFSDNYAAVNTAIGMLTDKINNSVLLYLSPNPMKSVAGQLRGGLVWRGVKLNDNGIFEKNEQDNMGDLSVDILLDASTSQRDRQELISSQGYIIAESLTRCNIPCRVMSFCSMTGYTIVRVFRDYGENGSNKRIFEYVSNGCNRDGLAIKAAHHMMNQSGLDHKILIVLSDVKPNDVKKIPSLDRDERIPYSSEAGVTDTAIEVRRARADGISVICVFTGNDEDISSAKLVYGRDFARITSVDKLADTVGILLQNQIKNL